MLDVADWFASAKPLDSRLRRTLFRRSVSASADLRKPRGDLTGELERQCDRITRPEAGTIEVDEHDAPSMRCTFELCIHESGDERGLPNASDAADAKHRRGSAS